MYFLHILLKKHEVALKHVYKFFDTLNIEKWDPWPFPLSLGPMAGLLICLWSYVTSKAKLQKMMPLSLHFLETCWNFEPPCKVVLPSCGHHAMRKPNQLMQRPYEEGGTSGQPPDIFNSKFMLSSSCPAWNIPSKKPPTITSPNPWPTETLITVVLSHYTLAGFTRLQ